MQATPKYGALITLAALLLIQPTASPATTAQWMEDHPYATYLVAAAFGAVVTSALYLAFGRGDEQLEVVKKEVEKVEEAIKTDDKVKPEKFFQRILHKLGTWYEFGKARKKKGPENNAQTPTSPQNDNFKKIETEILNNFTQGSKLYPNLDANEQ
ncbi:MAG: hypothetical protein M1549_00970 [Candidatus Dependentiae bacterium]|nr:hypothetical protein [Candidatus Dependentiae bacterium]